ncbi:MAG: class I SAM-dependent methyltransferase [Pseudomonadota bacterium]
MATLTTAQLNSQRQALAMALSTGNMAGAAQLLPRLIKAQPDDPALHHTAAELAWRQGNRTNALKHFGAAVAATQANPEHPQAAEISGSAARQLGHLLGSYAIDCKGLLTRPVLTALLSRSDVDPQAIAAAAAPVWMDSPPWRRAFNQSAGADIAKTVAWLLSRDGEAARKDPLTAALLRHAVLCDPKIEALLAALRHGLLGQDAPDIRFLRLIAQQWCLRDYACIVSVPEQALISQVTGQTTGQPAVTYLKRALYQDPADWLTAPDGVDAWCDQRVDERSAEIRLAQTMIRATNMADTLATNDGGMADDTGATDDDSAADATVRAQYERHPYPRWIGLTVPEPGSRRALAWRSDPRGDDPARKLFWQQSPCDVLIAGCGTGRHALMAALGYGPLAKVLAIDISARSLAYAQRMADQDHYNTSNLRFAQADLMGLHNLPDGLLPGGGFDLIESIGVLHHLADTGAGLAALSQYLKPGGLIQLGLYRKDGRRHVAAARAEIAALGLDPSNDDDIRRFRAHILANPDHPAYAALAHNRDFYSLPGCRDLLLHTRERDIQLQEIEGLLSAAGLEFAGMQMPDGVLQAFAKEHGATALNSLDSWHAFEQDRPDLFDAMYRFWAVKAAYQGGSL